MGEKQTYLNHAHGGLEAKCGLFSPYTKLNLRDRVLGEVQKNSFIALSGKGGRRGLMPSKLCVPPRRG